MFCFLLLWKNISVCAILGNLYSNHISAEIATQLSNSLRLNRVWPSKDKVKLLGRWLHHDDCDDGYAACIIIGLQRWLCLHYHCIVMMVMMVFWNYSSKDCMLELRVVASLPSHVFPFAAREIFVRNRNCQNMIEIFTQRTRSSNHCVKGQNTMVITQCFKRLFHQNLNSMLCAYFS